MPMYIKGVLIAFLEPVFHGGCNIVDHFLSNKVFPRLTTLVFFSSIATLVLSSITVFLFEPPHLLSPLLIFLVFVVALIEVGYLFPYYWSLGEIDTSIVASLFSLGKVILPLLAFFILGERLLPLQYAGFLLIIISSIVLSFEPEKLRLNRAFYFMLGISIILAGETILYKYAFTNGASWGSFIFWLAVFEVCITTMLMVATGALRELRSDITKAREVGWALAANEFFGWAGTAGNSLSLSILPVTVSQAIAGTQPLFVLLYAYLFKNKNPDLFREQIGASDIKKKAFLFTVTIVGVALVVASGSVEL